ncbi:MAG: UDP-glucose 4-epimerase [Desulfovibrio sp.]
MAKTAVLVTGGAGYIGSHTCKALALAGYNPIAYDNLWTGHRELVRWGDFVHGDILDTARLAETMRKYAIQGVIHFAARSDVGESVTKPEEYYHTNISGTLSLLNAMRAQNVRFIVVSSSCAVYGTPKTVPIAEDCPRHPVNPYGFTKLAMERMLDEFETPFGITSAALRYFNAAGADAEGETGEWHDPETHLIPRVFMAANSLAPELHIFGDDYDTSDGTCVRDYIHVADLATAHVKALAHLEKGGESIKLNLGTGRGYSVKELVATAETILGRAVPHSIHGRRAGDAPTLVADASKAKEVLGWQAEQSGLEHILRTAAAFADVLRRRP